ncbi:hypothetical protein N0V90_010507 [Kalmusia sp. IMI 367209]|nr:hypothetical protein N0V90_010507 [Kalmusia sp. IMI 367209]
MVSSSRKRATAARKAKLGGRKDSVTNSSQCNNTINQTAVNETNARCEEAPLPMAWPYPELTSTTHINAKGDEEQLVGGWVTTRGQRVRRDIGGIFQEEALSSDVNPNTEFAKPGHPLHELWKQYNSGRPTEYKPNTVPINLRPEQQAKAAEKDAEKGITYVDAASHNLKGNVEKTKKHITGIKECPYWSQGRCKHVDTCHFLHPPEKAPKNSPASPWRSGTAPGGMRVGGSTRPSGLIAVGH